MTIDFDLEPRRSALDRVVYRRDRSDVAYTPPSSNDLPVTAASPAPCPGM